MRERSSDDDDITEMLVHEDTVIDSGDSGDTKGDRDDVTDIHIVVIPPDSSSLFHPLPLPFTQNVGINVIIPSCEDIVIW